jgi:hypothetical protein
MEHIDKTIEELRVKIAEKESELAGMKKTVNQLCILANHGPIYINEVEPEKSSTGLLRGDEYYMQPIAKVIGLILDKRKMSGTGPATIKEIYDDMRAGGYKFDSKDDENAMRGISISMSKNVAKFHKLPSGKFGLTVWYPELKEPKEPEKPKKGKKGKKGKRKVATVKTTKQVAVRIPLEETMQYAGKTEDKQPQQEAETPVVVKKVGRPKKLEESKEDTKE